VHGVTEPCPNYTGDDRYREVAEMKTALTDDDQVERGGARKATKSSLPVHSLQDVQRRPHNLAGVPGPPARYAFAL